MTNFLLLGVGMVEPVEIPTDIYESTTEFVVVMPLGGVKKSSIQLHLNETRLTITGEREQPSLKPTLMPQEEQCFRGTFTKSLELPPNSYFNNIHSELSPENILFVIVPKVIVPEKITVHIK